MNYWVGKKVIVTGASGLIGSHLFEELYNLKADVFGTYFKSEPFMLNNMKAVDLREYNECERVCEKIDAVFHCAAVSEGAKTMSENMLVLVRDNVIINVNMLEAAYRAKVKLFVFISSTTVNYLKEYRGVADVKDFTEKLCELYTQKGMQCVIIRPTNVFGPRDKFDDRAHTIPMFIKRAIAQENPFTIWGDGNQIRDFVYVKDLVKKILEVTIIKDIQKSWTPVTIGSGRGRIVKSIAETIYYQINSRLPEFKFDRDKPIMIQDNLPKIDYMANDTSLFDSLDETIKWYKENKDG